MAVPVDVQGSKDQPPQVIGSIDQTVLIADKPVLVSILFMISNMGLIYTILLVVFNTIHKSLRRDTGNSF